MFSSGAVDAVGVGAVLGERFRLERKLGEGGMGAVYAAADLRLRRPVAVKLLRADLAPDADSSSRFELEARAISTLGHPHIGVLFDFHAAADPVPFLVLELIDGPSLHQAMQQSPRFALPRALHIAQQMLSGIAAAHEAGVIHRDIKPSNIMLVQTGAVPDLVRIVDFGVARMTETITRGHQTSDGQLIGTPAYMSPEQAMGVPAHPGVDVYAAALCLYEMLAGRCPFSMGRAALTLAAVRDLVPPPLHALRPDLPVELSHLIARELSKNPAQRVGDAARLASVLERFRSPSGAQLVRVQGPHVAALAPATASTLSAPPPSMMVASTALAPPAALGVSVPAPAAYPAQAPTPVTVHRTPAWVGGLVGALLVLVLGLGAVVVFFVLPSRFGVPPAASASATIAPALASSGASPSAVAASAKPAESVSLSPVAPAGSGAPNAGTPRADAGISRVVPAGGKPDCLCIPTRSKEGFMSLCRVQETSTFCRCLMTCAVPMTQDPVKGYVCPPSKSLESYGDRPGAKHGAPCSGFIGTDPSTRTWECNACPGEGSWYSGAEGQACSGTHMETGNRYEGQLSCGRRRTER